MSTTPTKTLVATGASSGLGFELVKQLLAQAQQPYKIVLGARDVEHVRSAFADLQYDGKVHSLTVLPLQLAHLDSVRSFARQALQHVGDEKLDYLLLNAGQNRGAEVAAPAPLDRWSETLVVNHTSQHYLVHLLRAKLEADGGGRVVVVSSGAIRMVPDPSVLHAQLLAGSGADHWVTYANSKFVQLLAAHWWRRQMQGRATVVAVSPGLIPATGISRHMSSDMVEKFEASPDAKSVPEGARSILAAFTRDDFPDNPDQIFLTSWGEWWGTDVIGPTLDKELQDKWSFSKEEIEKEAGLLE